MRIKQDVFETHYLWTLEGFLYDSFLNKNEKPTTILNDFINDITDIIETLPTIQKNFFISHLKKELESKPKFQEDTFASFQLFVLPFIQKYTTFINSLIYFDSVGAEKRTFESLNKESINDFFDEIKEGNLTQIEIHNRVESITSSMLPEKLKILLDDFEDYLLWEKEDRLAEIKEDEIVSACADYQAKGKEIPFYYARDFERDKDGKFILTQTNTKIIDVEKIFYPYDFYCCYRFKNKLEDLINKAEKDNAEVNSNKFNTNIEKNAPLLKELSPQQTEMKTEKFKVPQIALIYVYEGIQITRDNAGEIAAKHGYTSKNSGEGLFQDYINYSSTANRKGKPTPCTPKKLKNKIELFESVVNYLSDNNKQRAIDEIKILNTIFENEYQ